MKKIREIKRIDTSKLRNMCMNNGWYTAGSIEDYSNMFRMCIADITTNLLFEIAKNIYEHTDVDRALQGCSSDYSDDENILNMMIYINDCTYVYYEMD